MKTPVQITTLFLVIQFIAILMNILLIFLALRVPKRPREIGLAIVLAVIDITLPLITVSLTLLNLVTNQNLKVIPSACRFKGPIEYIGMFLSMLLVAIVAFERVNHVFRVRIPKICIISLVVFTLGYCCLVFSVSYFSEYHLLPNGFDCAPLTASNVLSTALTVSFGLSQLTFLTITISCYMFLTLKVLPYDEPRIQDSRVINRILPRYSQTPVVVRTSLICFTYFMLIVPACILLAVEAILNPADTDLVSTIIDICLDSIVLANPCIVIFAHSLIYRELTNFFNSIFSKPTL